MNEQLDMDFAGETTELPRLPSSWSWSTLGVWLAGIEAGKSFRCEERPPNAQEVGVVKVSSVTWGTFQEHESKTCKDAALIRPAFFVRPGDFLISRANTIELVGACVLVGELQHRKLMLSDKILRLRFSEGDARWFLWALRTAAGRAEIQRLATGNQESMRNIGQDRIGQIRLPIAPRREQARILSDLETQFSRLDAAVEGLKRVRANLKRYRASVLKAAVEGRLVPTEAALAKQEGRSFEPASVLLRRILKERRERWEQAELDKLKASGKTPKDDKWKSRYEEPAAPDTSELPELPAGWCWVALSSVADVQLGQQRAPMHADAAVQHPYVRAANITWSGLNLDDVKAMGFPNPERYRLQYGDVLLSEASGSPMEAGKPAVWKDEIPGACYQKTLLRVRAINSHGLLPDFLCCVFLRDCVTGKFARLAPGVGIVHLTAERLVKWPIPLAPEAEQHRIVAQVQSLESSIDASSTMVARQIKRADRLRQSILKWAFEGKLVDQDPNDEPASVLLDRIRAERASAASAKTRRSQDAPAKQASARAAGRRPRAGARVRGPRGAS